MVVRVRHCIQDSPCITVGNQKCVGAAPILSKREARINTIEDSFHIISDVAPINIIVEPNA